MVGQKKLISQRWTLDLINKVKEFSELHNISITDFTSNALLVYIEILKKLSWEKMNLNNQLNEIREILSNNSHQDKINKEISDYSKIGFIKKRIMDYLQSHPNIKYRSTDISQILKIPQPTVRTYIRLIASDNLNFKLYPGRPNVIEYIELNYEKR